MGHSGSTLIDMVLGQFHNVVSTGELKHLTWQLFRELRGDNDSQGTCTCDQKFAECVFWKRVFDDIANQLNCTLEEIPSELQIKYFDHLSFFHDSLRLKFFRKLYKIFLRYHINPHSIFSLAFTKINKNNQFLYETISRVSKKQYIVDSSKDVIKYNELRKFINIFPIILIRQPENILTSQHLQNTDRRRFFKNWVNYYHQLLPVIHKLNEEDFHIISFEKFINHPESIIIDLSKKIDINPDLFQEEFETRGMHLAAGNPMRYQKKIKIAKRELDQQKFDTFLAKGYLDDFFINRMKQ